jgi:hypothetical protein
MTLLAAARFRLRPGRGEQTERGLRLLIGARNGAARIPVCLRESPGRTCATDAVGAKGEEIGGAATGELRRQKETCKTIEAWMEWMGAGKAGCGE